ncbi:putative DinB superfamily Sulfatase modifying factor enzyme 1 [Trypanosoma vivax]|uniref:Generic methyltransferase n=1 Tax=Trypanosoma vivax (strain Y486) TaxID=1055687 RepID=G0TTH6_TRYVY|nr:hypothetical protein TRVL_03696 [Trypanosoma vivax]KAH8607169.1 putative DinB superfamily Sulfatase modifying factor enzyme 1 [Trypanosoma vivax]CCC47257.1 conserved hypothetical protein [Trypanosoma vivax Y486]
MAAFSLNHYSHDEVNQLFHLPSPRDLFRQRSPTVDAGDPKLKMEEIRMYVHSTMELYERVFESLVSDEAFFVQPIHRLRHPLIFYYGHTAAFFINKLCVAGLSTHIQPHIEETFAVGVDEMNWDDLNEDHYDWPTVAQVTEYRKSVRRHVDQMMSGGKYVLQLPLTFANSTLNADNSFWWLMLMCAEHERIHLETASVHVRELPLKYVKSPPVPFCRRCEEPGNATLVNELVEVPGGVVNVGRRPNSAVYGWDCDYSDGGYAITVPTFKASKYLVSNAEFFAFVNAGGYNTQRYWDEEGWRWVQWKKPQCPWFWVRDESRPSGYALRLQTELIDLPLGWPCELNNLEAQAFCNFKSEQLGKQLRMLTESEWLLLWDRYVGMDQMLWDNAPGNLHLEHFHSSCPVDKFSHGPFFDIVGNVWQHCVTAVYPYPGYRVHPFYDDFSMPTFDGRHTCIKGGTWISTGNEATRDARYAFRRHFFQYVGVRYVEGQMVNEGVGILGTLRIDPEVDMIADANFRASFNDIPNGCVKIAQYAMKQFGAFSKTQPRQALDFACGAGRVSFELTAMFDKVIGSDFSARPLTCAYAIRERGRCRYTVIDSSTSQPVTREFNASECTWDSTRDRAVFLQADPTNLHPHMKDFSMIICWNTFVKSYNPAAVPQHLLERLIAGGLLVFGTEIGRSTVCFCDAERRIAEPVELSDLTETRVSELLGVGKYVDRVGELEEVVVVFPESDTVANLIYIQLFAYRKR